MHAKDLFNEFALSTNAFLPDEPPLQCLHDPRYQPWEDLINALPELIQSRRLRGIVQQLPILLTEGLTTEREWRRAYVILTFLAHGYIWGDDTPAEVPSLYQGGLDNMTDESRCFHHRSPYLCSPSRNV